MTRALWTAGTAVLASVACSSPAVAPHTSRPAAVTTSHRHRAQVEARDARRPAPPRIVSKQLTRPKVRASRAARTYKRVSGLQRPTDAQLLRLRLCESGGNYRAVSPSGRYRGAYQAWTPTWRYVMADTKWASVDPAAAPPAVQDDFARRLYAQRGWQPWPHCGRRAA